MVAMDVRIDLMRQSRWKKRHMFISNLQQQQQHQFDKPSSSSTAVNHELNHHFMNNDLYWAAAGAASPDKFDQILKNSNSTRTEEDVFINNVMQCVSPVGNTVLHVAAAHGNVTILIHICSLNPSLILSRNCNGDTPLHLAAGAGHLDVVIKLITAMKSFYYDSENKLGWRQVTDFEGLHGSWYESENWHGAEAEPIYKDEMLRMKNEQGNTAMHTALINFNKEIALFLVQGDPGTMFCLNNDDKSGWYLAVEAGYTNLIKELLEIYDDEIHLYEMIKGKLPLHAAVSLKQMDAVRVLVDKEPRLVNLRDEEGKTPLHIAAFNGHLDGVTYMLEMNATAAVVKDDFGFFPIHWAALNGHAHVVHELLTHLPDPVEIVDNKCRNILHIAAESGRNNVVIYILKNIPACKKLINAKDVDGNTPLHLATFNWHTRIVTALVRNVYTDLNLTNNDGETALDAAEAFEESIICYQQRLTWTALLAAGAKRAPQKYYQNLTKQPSESSRPTSNMNIYKDRVNTLLVVATLIATITFAAGFTLPGGYSSSDQNLGQATLLGNKVFSLFCWKLGTW